MWLLIRLSSPRHFCYRPTVSLYSGIVFKNEKIEILWNNEITKINGNDQVESVTLKNTVDESNHSLTIDGVFMAIGHTPNVGFLNGLLDLDDKGYIKTGYSTETSTSIPGVFAAGDVADSVYRQAVTAAGTGCQAAIDAERWLDH